MRRIHLPVLIFVLAFSAYAAAANVTISVWHAIPEGPGIDVFHQAVEEFQRLHPNITVETVNHGGYNETLNMFVTAYAGGAAPNVAMFAKVGVVSVVETGALLPLRERLERDGILDDIYPQFQQAVTIFGEIYGLPYSSSTAIEYHNLDRYRERGLAEEFPKTWAELEEYATRLTYDRNGDGEPDAFGIAFAPAWNFLYDQWIYQAGGSILNEAGNQFVFNSPEAIRAMEFVQALANEKRVATTGGNNAFTSGTAAIRRASTAQLGQFIEVSDFEVGVAPMSCDVRCWASISGGVFTLVNTGTPEQQEAAWEFLKYIYGPEPLARYSLASGYMVSRKSALESEIMRVGLAQDPRFLVSYLQAEVGEPRAGTHVPFWEQVQSLIANAGRQMFNQNADVKSLFDNAVNVANGYLREYLERTGRDTVFKR